MIKRVPAPKGEFPIIRTDQGYFAAVDPYNVSETLPIPDRYQTGISKNKHDDGVDYMLVRIGYKDNRPVTCQVLQVYNGAIRQTSDGEVWEGRQI